MLLLRNTVPVTEAAEPRIAFESPRPTEYIPTIATTPPRILEFRAPPTE